jgi:hypothetical protein
VLAWLEDGWTLQDPGNRMRRLDHQLHGLFLELRRELPRRGDNRLAFQTTQS